MDPTAFRKLALAELSAVYRLAYHLSPRRDQVDDLVQETYLRAFKYGTNVILTEHGLRPYLFKILHNVLNTALSKVGRQPQAIDGPEPAAPDGNDFSQERCTDLPELNWESIDERLKKAIDNLPPAHRLVFLLCAVEGLRYREISDVVGVPVGTVMSRLHRARHLLAEQLADLAQEQGFRTAEAQNATAMDGKSPRQG